MVINEYRLNPARKEAQEIIVQQMQEYFFGEGAALPPGFVPPQSKT
ncbi:MAG: Fe(2+)-trafficking protein [Terriglobales bacterium]